ncbi:MAG: hypothetical protein ACP5KN_17805 [Armatimonadota bacterium]
MAYIQTGGSGAYAGPNMRTASAELILSWGLLENIEVMFGGLTATKL